MGRKDARAAAMQMIFENLSGGDGGEDTLQMVYDEMRSETAGTDYRISKSAPNETDRAYIEKLLGGVLDRLDDLDRHIEEASQGWAIDRMPLVDLTILRLAAWEILYEENVPAAVAVNEAVELANRYSDPEKSSRFINGVLGAIARSKGDKA